MQKQSINGGSPVRVKPWSAGAFHFKEEIAAVAEALSGPSLPMARGKYVMAYRAMLAKTYGARHVVTTSSGTTAIHVALAAAGVGVGDEVITSPITDYGTVIGIIQLNAVPVFCDVVHGSMAMDAAKIESLMTKRTKVIMPVHIGGYPVDMLTIMKIARKHRVKVVEDCAQSHMTRIGKTYAGCFGDFGAFSTNESKHMKTGEGGFVLCRSKSAALYADLFADKCYHRFPEAPATPAFPALNVRMSDITAAIAIEQLRKLPGWIRRRQAAGLEIECVLSRYPLKSCRRPKEARCSYWWCAFFLDEEERRISAEEFVKMMNAEGIPCWRGGQRLITEWEIFKKLNDNPNYFRNYRPGALRKGAYRLDRWPEAKWAVENIIVIPVNQHTGKSEIRDLDRALKKIFSFISG